MPINNCLKIISADFYDSGSKTYNFNHMILIVDFGNGGKYYADVGFGHIRGCWDPIRYNYILMRDT